MFLVPVNTEQCVVIHKMMLGVLKGKNMNVSSILKQYQGHKNLGLSRLEDHSASFEQPKSVHSRELSDRV